MKLYYGKVLLCCMAVLFLSCAPSPPKVAWDKTELIQRQVVYKTIGDVQLKMHIFELPERNLKKKTPAVVFFFGGGWVGGNPKQFYAYSKYYACRGMLTMSAEYRIKNNHGTTPFECVKDGKSAVRWIRKYADELGVDPDKIVASGGSAGGHVAACTGVLDGFEEQGEDLSISSKPNAMMLFCPVIDTTEKGYGHKKVGKNPQQLSPTHNIKKSIPPAIIFHGIADTTVPYENAERFCRLMKESGNICELVGFQGAEHGFFNHTSFRPKNDPNTFDNIIRRADKFLNKTKILKGKSIL